MAKSKYKPHKYFKIRPVIPLDSLAQTAFIGAKYNLDKMIELTAHPCIQTMWQDDNSLDERTKNQLQTELNQFHWHVRAFFWELVASFDTILQWANQKYKLGVQEHKVRWDHIDNQISQSEQLQVEWKKKQKILEKAWDSEWYYEVRQYRNFAHRAFLFVQTEFDAHYGKSEPTLKKIWLLPAREGQPDYVDIIAHLSGYLEKMEQLGLKVFSEK